MHFIDVRIKGTKVYQSDSEREETIPCASTHPYTGNMNMGVFGQVLTVSKSSICC